MTDAAAIPLRERPAWSALGEHHARIADVHLRELFATDAERGPRLSLEAAGLYLDYSKQRVTDDTLRLLLELARQVDLGERIEAMFRGDHINVTEDRAVLHVALRAPRDQVIRVDGEDVVPGVHEVLDRMSAFADTVTAAGPATPARVSATSSTSASAAPTWARSWPTRRCASTRTGS
jgi:glucose-6-phosphate isomerase